jgi:iron complex transport system permease protein
MKTFKLNKLVLSGALLICILVSLSLGASSFSLGELLQGDELARQVFFQVRLVRVIALIFSACGMVVCGLIMQQLAQNKFASPTSATTLDGAKLGMMFSIVLLPNNFYAKILLSFLFALLSTTAFIVFIAKIKIKNVIFVPLVGLVIGGVIDSITTYIGYQTDRIQNMNSWLQANMTHLLKGNYEILYVIIPAVLFAYVYANQFTIIGMGKSFATNLGLNYRRVTGIGLFLVAVISAAVIISVGSIPFLGLIIPNIASAYYGDKMKSSIVETSLLGCIFLFVCDIIGRVLVFPYEIPLTLTVGVIGCLVFLLLIFHKNKGHKSKKEVNSH